MNVPEEIEGGMAHQVELIIKRGTLMFKMISAEEHARRLEERAKRTDPEPMTWAQLARCYPQLTRYQEYLMSPEWAEKRGAVWDRCGGVCERCHAAPMEHLHHLSYRHLYREPLDELAGICARCHGIIHGKVSPESAGHDAHPSEM